LQNGFGDAPVWVTGAVAAVGAVTAGLYYWLAWRVARYRIDGVDLVVENGILFKRSRRVPLARLQAVDVVRPLIARVIGLAELRLEVAGGKSSDAALAYLAEASAQRVRNDLLVLAAGLRDDVTLEPAPAEADEHVVASVPFGMLVAANLVSGPAPILILGVVVSTAGAIISGEIALSVGVIASTTFGAGAQVWNAFTRDYGTVVAESPDGLRIRRGLLETRSQTVPPGRVQGARLDEPIVWRWLGWVSLAATVAGYAGSEQSQRSTTIVPVARRALGEALVDRVLPGVDWKEVPLASAPHRARWRAPIEARRLGAGVGDTGVERVLVTIRGRFGSRTDIVPLARVQSVRITQGPFQRLLRLATVHADLSSGPVKARALHRDEQEARHLVDRLVADARVARAAARPDRWLRTQGS
jgi:putative membrane protein